MWAIHEPTTPGAEVRSTVGRYGTSMLAVVASVR